MITVDAADTAISERKEWFASMLRIRMIEEAIAERYSAEQMRCPVHLSIGQEAIAVGVCSAVEQRDYLLGTHRSHAHYLAKGGNLRAMIAEIYGRETGCSRGRGGSMHLIDLEAGILATTPIVGSTLPIAVGTAFGSVMQRDDRVTIVFFGDGTTEEGVFSESLNFAALKSLPIIFVCENNLYSVYSPLAVRQPANRDRTAIAAAHGVHAERGDGDDILSINRLTQDAVARARSGRGPSFLEFDTYRWREHCGPNYDNDIGYRSEVEFQQWKLRDPLQAQERALLAEEVYDQSELAEVRTMIAREIDDAFAFALQSPFPPDVACFDHLYAE